MTVQKDGKLNSTKCLSVCEIQVYLAEHFTQVVEGNHWMVGVLCSMHADLILVYDIKLSASPALTLARSFISTIIRIPVLQCNIS